MSVKVGKVKHYYNKIQVAVVAVVKPIATGDKIKISGHDKEFVQVVTSMQVEHEMIKKAKKGVTIGMKVDKPVKEGDEIFKEE